MGGLGFGSHADSIAPVPWYSWVLNPLLGALLGFYIPMLFSYMQGIPFVDQSPSPEELSYTCAGMGAPHARAPNSAPISRAYTHARRRTQVSSGASSRRRCGRCRSSPSAR